MYPSNKLIQNYHPNKFNFWRQNKKMFLIKFLIPISAAMINDCDHSAAAVIQRTLARLLRRLARVRLCALRERLGRRQKLRGLEPGCEPRLERIAARVGARWRVAVSVRLVVVVLPQRVTPGRRRRRVARKRLEVRVHRLKDEDQL